MLGSSNGRRIVGALLAITLVGLAVGCGDGGTDSTTSSSTKGDDASAKTLTVRAIRPGTLTGSAYDQVHQEAIEAAIKKIGEDRFDFEHIDSVPYTDRLTQTVLQLFQQGADLVVDNNVAGPLFFDACKEVPDKKCLGFSEPLSQPTTPPAPNLRGMAFDIAPMYYVAGVAAGRMTKSGTLGFVTPFKLPEFTAPANAFLLGCQSVRPDCKLRNVYVNAFFDPPKTIEAVNSLMDSGVDVIGHMMDDASPLTTAQKRGGYSFGLYKDQASLAPKGVITSILYGQALETIYEQELRRALDGGAWTPSGPINFGPDPAPYGEFGEFGENVPEEVQAAVKSALDKIRGGDNPFKGPITDAKGKVQIPAGEAIDLRGAYMYSKWTWGVKGARGL